MIMHIVLYDVYTTRSNVLCIAMRPLNVSLLEGNNNNNFVILIIMVNS